jgi:hypothetical protein
MIITCIQGENNIYIVNRGTKQVAMTIKNPSGSTMPLCMKLIPDFGYSKQTYAFVMDKLGLTLVNLTTLKASVILQNETKAQPWPQY